MLHYRTHLQQWFTAGVLHLNADGNTCFEVWTEDKFTLKIRPPEKQIISSFLICFVRLLLQKCSRCKWIYVSKNAYFDCRFWSLFLVFCLFSWSSCTRWASAPERTVWGSCPGTSGTCSWPVATWSSGHGTAPVRGRDLKLVQNDESEVIYFC